MTDIDPSAWIMFERIARTGGISAAARETGVAKGTVSKALALLEQRLGATLFHRSSRQLVPSAAGERLLPYARGVRAAADAASEAALEEAEGLSGPVRIAAPLSFGVNHLAAPLAAFQARHPGVTVDLCLDDGTTDLIGGGHDIGIRIGRLTDSSLRVRRLGSVVTRLVAAPHLSASARPPAHPHALEGCDGLFYANMAPQGLWRLRQAGGTVSAEVRPRVRLRANNGDVLVAAAIAGLGVALLPDFLVDRAISDGRLVHLLPGWQGPAADIALLTPPGAIRPARVRLLIDHLAAAVSSACAAQATVSATRGES